MSTFHIVSLPHTNTTPEYSWCAFTSNVIKFSNMMFDLGHEVYLYAGQDNDARCTEHVSCISKEDMPKIAPTVWPEQSYFDLFNRNAIKELSSRIKPRDYICLIAGYAQEPIARAFPGNMPVEFAIGYGGAFSPYRVYCSQAWRNTVQGAQSGGNSHSIIGRFFDTVIPHFIDPDDFPFVEDKEDYFLFIGRLIEGKGYQIAVEVCEKLGLKLKIAGAGSPPEYGEYVGIVNPNERGKLMSRAKAVFVPTLYSEPFGLVMIEAMACGTPVISTDFGAFPEINQQGVTGYRCNSFGEFMAATSKVSSLDPKTIREYAISKYSTEVIGVQYEAYFKRLDTLWDKGFYNESPGEI